MYRYLLTIVTVFGCLWMLVGCSSDDATASPSPSSLSSNAALRALVPSQGALVPEFDGSVHDYELSVPNGTTSVTLTAEVQDSQARSIKLTQDQGVESRLENGQPSEELEVPPVGMRSLIEIVVLAEDKKSTEIYTVELSQVALEQPPVFSTDATLATLVPSAGALIPVFAPATTNYSLRVPFEATSVALTPTATSPAASITINGTKVPNGKASTPIDLNADGTSTKLEIVVTAEDKTTAKTYAVAISHQAAPGNPVIYTVGDSTMADYGPANYPNRRGWGQMFPSFITDSKLTSLNMAMNGMSSKSFYAGSWSSTKALLKPGDYVFIQFGHNDEKDAGIEGTGGVGTDAWGAYHDYLTRYVKETRALGGIPVLFTPVVRLGWDGASLTPTACHDLTGNGTAVDNADYPAAMRDVATKLECPLIDLTAASKALVESYGPTEAKAQLYISTDNTHLQISGATEYARLAVEGLIAKGLFVGQLNPNLGIVLGGSGLDFGSTYVGETTTRGVSLMGVGLVPAAGEVTVTVPSGFGVSQSSSGPFQTSLQIQYSWGLVPWGALYVQFQPTESRTYEGALTAAAADGTLRNVSLIATAVAVPTGAAVARATYPLDSASAATGCTTNGPIVCAQERLSGLYVKDYQTLTALEPIPTALSVQMVSISSSPSADTWPSEKDFNPARYVEFAVSPDTGKSLRVESISLYLGATATPNFGFRVQCAKAADFGDALDLVNAPSNAANTLNFITRAPMTEVVGGETLLIRVFPYTVVETSAKYFGMRALTVQGVGY